MTSSNTDKPQTNRVSIALLAVLMASALTACTVKQTPVAPGVIPRVNTVKPKKKKQQASDF